MSIPLEASVKGATTLPFTGHIQSRSSLSVPAAFGGSGAGAGAGGGTGTAAGPGPGVAGGDSGAPAASGEPPASAESCARARSENGTFVARGSTLVPVELEIGRASMGGPAVVSGVMTFAPGGAAPVAGAPPGGA